MRRHRMTLEVPFGDCDPAGIVYFPNYFRYFDNATAQLFSAALGVNKRLWIERFGIVGIPVVDTGARFVRPSRFGDAVVIETAIEELKRSSFVIAHRLLNGDELAVEAREVRVWAAPDPDRDGAIRALPLPAEVRTALA